MTESGRIQHNRRVRHVLIPVIVLTLLLIWSNSMQSGAVSGEMSGSLTAFLERLLGVEIDEFLLRKAAHFSEYALLGAELSLLLSLQRDTENRPLARGRNLLDFPAIGFTAAAVDETIQIFSGGRGSSLIDVWIDTAGLLTGFFLTILVFQLFRHFAGQTKE